MQEGENLYTLLDKLRTRPALWIGKTSITLLRSYIDGYLHAWVCLEYCVTPKRNSKCIQ
jgi:hypothetical protein